MEIRLFFDLEAGPICRIFEHGVHRLYFNQDIGSFYDTWLDAGFSLHRTGFDPMSLHVNCVVEKSGNMNGLCPSS
jgi:hypothetical protein